MASERNARSSHADAEGKNDSATVVEENDDTGLPTIYSYPGNRSKSKVWKYFGFLKVKQGPPTRENLDKSKAVCRYCRKEYANKGLLLNLIS